MAEIEMVCAWCLEDAVCLHQLWCCLCEASFPPVQPKSYPEAGDVAEIEMVCAWCLEDAACLHQLWCCLREASFRFLRFLRVLVFWFLGFLVS